ncbi:MAG: hypothetical protein QOG53_1908 [Frankiales bacterium]|nr:hypothetical protein [Frankiales bacterium]
MRRLPAVVALSLTAVVSLVGVVGPATTSAGTPGTPAPTVLVTLTDDQTPDGFTIGMPYTSSRTDWVSFTGIVDNALCCPSRSGFFSGRYDVHNGVINNVTSDNLDRDATLFRWFAKAGWDVGLYGKLLNPYRCTPGWSGVVDWHAICPGTKDVYFQYDYKMNNNGVVNSYGSSPADYQVNVLADFIIKKIRSTPAYKPLFLLFTPTSTHWPWVAAPGLENAFYDVAVPRYPNQRDDVSDKPLYIQRQPVPNLRTQDANRRAMWRGSLSVDKALQRIESALREAGRWDSTTEALWSDNGYAFGAHRWIIKRCEYEECARVPMVVRVPGIAGRDDGRLMTNLDLSVTLLALTGVKGGVRLDGRNMEPVLRGNAPAWTDAVLQHWPGGDADGTTTHFPNPGYWCVRVPHWRYCELASGEKELYDLFADPYELDNLAGQTSFAESQSQNAARLNAMKPKDVVDTWIPWESPSVSSSSGSYRDLE